MRHFLVIYDRRGGRIVRRQAYRAAAEALRARFAAEREFHGQSDIEVVVLGGESWRSVERTHSRYFNRACRPGTVGGRYLVATGSPVWRSLDPFSLADPRKFNRCQPRPADGAACWRSAAPGPPP